MRKIEKEMQQALRNGRNFRRGNTAVIFNESGAKVYLHGNCIFSIRQGVKRFTLAGWNSVTTRSRLNALGVGVYQKNFTPIYNGVAINSREWYTV